jgi:hypothetical protein
MYKCFIKLEISAKLALFRLVKNNKTKKILIAGIIHHHFKINKT